MPELCNLRITSESPITIRSITLVDGEFTFTELTVAELKLMIERAGARTFRLDEIVATMGEK